MIAAIIVAGGAGLRMKTPLRKQYLSLNGIPILARTLKIFMDSRFFDQICAVVPGEDIPFCQEHLLPHLQTGPENPNPPLQFVAGGKERQDSVYKGILSIENPGALVVIHDGVRPFIAVDRISACIQAAEASGAATLGIPVQDTLKKVDSDGHVLETLERNRYWYTQTPQAFQYPLLRKAHEKAREEGFYGTDDAGLVERMGGSVMMVAGDKLNIKITTAEDMALAGMILEKR
jgi:2-C-methyl-D-erythritol 4-phosphate cytidylyltransferase